MKWWDDLWLNESFANMMEYVSVDAIEPSWNIFEDFQTTGVPHALQRDATDGVQSVHMKLITQMRLTPSLIVLSFMPKVAVSCICFPPLVR